MLRVDGGAGNAGNFHATGFHQFHGVIADSGEAVVFHGNGVVHGGVYVRSGRTGDGHAIKVGNIQGSHVELHIGTGHGGSTGGAVDRAFGITLITQ